MSSAFSNDTNGLFVFIPINISNCLRLFCSSVKKERSSLKRSWHESTDPRALLPIEKMPDISVRCKKHIHKCCDKSRINRFKLINKKIAKARPLKDNLMFHFETKKSLKIESFVKNLSRSSRWCLKISFSYLNRLFGYSLTCY